MQEKLKNTKGITLVALIITIIILLILAGVTISLVIGDNGLITKSKQGVGEYQTRAEEEKAQLDEFEQGMLENSVDKEAMKILVNSGEDGIVNLPMLRGIYEIEWGDGEIKRSQEEGMIDSRRKIASVTKFKLAEISEENIEHEYKEKNKEYEIKISGTCDGISYHRQNSGAEKILKILQWGETGAVRIDLSNCVNLREIAKPTEKSFKELIYIKFSECESLTSIPENLFANCPNVTGFSETFYGCTSLTNIPENLFANCPNVTDFSGTFYGCESLTSIPEKLFANCPNVTSFRHTFYGCKNLTGNSIKLWSETERKEKGIDENNGGTNCYCGCTKLTDYNEIPRKWKESYE